jgi:hypothetical protein
MSTWTEDHKRIAAGAMNTLEEARTLSRDAALARLQPLRRKMQNDHPDDLIERANAWLAVCRLCVELPQSDNDELGSLWQDAIKKTSAWLDPDCLPARDECRHEAIELSPQRVLAACDRIEPGGDRRCDAELGWASLLCDVQVPR